MSTSSLRASRQARCGIAMVAPMARAACGCHRQRPVSLSAAARTISSFVTPVGRPSYARLPSNSVPAYSHTRYFSVSAPSRIKELEYGPEKPGKYAPLMMSHPIYTQEQMEAVSVSHRKPRDFSDRVALIAVKLLRTGLDFASGYRHDKEVKKLANSPPGTVQKFAMDEKKYLTRNIFLESVAGVPGMVAGMLRHLRSMRLMRRDHGWIETLLEESCNERMHLLIFLKMAEPGIFMRFMVLMAQGVFFNAMFISYVLSPRTCHRFVGYLEEEAVLTYSREIKDIEDGKLPKWAALQAPQIAVDYYQMPEDRRSLKDMLHYIRADEAKHREVNHTLGNLTQATDPNPYVFHKMDTNEPHPTHDLTHQKPTGWERDEVFKKS